MQRSWRTLLPLLILIVLVGYLYAHRDHPLFAPAPPTPPPIAAGVDQPREPATLPGFLPPQAVDTVALIESGGPFPYRQDGQAFGNYEHLLPEKARGYYHEYTVETPGAHDRGARHIITGGTPPVVYYYTDDHYRSFREFTVSR